MNPAGYLPRLIHHGTAPQNDTCWPILYRSGHGRIGSGHRRHRNIPAYINHCLLSLQGNNIGTRKNLCLAIGNHGINGSTILPLIGMTCRPLAEANNTTSRTSSPQSRSTNTITTIVILRQTRPLPLNAQLAGILSRHRYHLGFNRNLLSRHIQLLYHARHSLCFLGSAVYQQITGTHICQNPILSFDFLGSIPCGFTRLILFIVLGLNTLRLCLFLRGKIQNCRLTHIFQRSIMYRDNMNCSKSLGQIIWSCHNPGIPLLGDSQTSGFSYLLHNIGWIFILNL